MNAERPHRPTSVLEMRKELVRLRLQLHRQELHHQTLRLSQPLQQVRAWQRRAPLLGLAGVTLLGFVGGFGGRGAQRWLRRSRSLLPLLVVAVRLFSRSRTAKAAQPPQPPAS